MYLEPLSVASMGFVSNNFSSNKALNISAQGFLIKIEIISNRNRRGGDSSHYRDINKLRQEKREIKKDKFIKITVYKDDKVYTKVEKVNITSFNIDKVKIEEKNSNIIIKIKK